MNNIFCAADNSPVLKLPLLFSRGVTGRPRSADCERLIVECAEEIGVMVAVAEEVLLETNGDGQRFDPVDEVEDEDEEEETEEER